MGTLTVNSGEAPDVCLECNGLGLGRVSCLRFGPDAGLGLDCNFDHNADNGLDERVPASGNDDIHELVHGCHDFHGFAVFCWNELNGKIGQSGLKSTCLQGLGNGEV